MAMSEPVHELRSVLRQLEAWLNSSGEDISQLEAALARYSEQAALLADLLEQDSVSADQLSGLAELHQRVFALMQSRHAELAHQLSSERQVTRIQRAYGG